MVYFLRNLRLPLAVFGLIFLAATPANLLNNAKYTVARTESGRKCVAADAVSCMNLAEKNLLIARNARLLALEQLRTACDSGTGVACLRLGQLHQENHEHELAERFFRKSCSTGQPKKSKHCSPITDEQKVVNLKVTAEACKKGVVLSCLNYSEYLAENNRGQDANRILQKICQKREPKGCLTLGLRYNKVNDFENAILYFDKACQLGSRISCRWRRAASRKLGQKSRALASP